MTLALKHKKKNKSICAFCGYTLTKRALHIHHIDGDHHNNNEKNLVIVCANCHAEAHEKQQMRRMNLTLLENDTSKKNLPVNICQSAIDGLTDIEKMFIPLLTKQGKIKIVDTKEKETPSKNQKKQPIVIEPAEFAALDELHQSLATVLEKDGRVVFKLTSDEADWLKEIAPGNYQNLQRRLREGTAQIVAPKEIL